MAAAAKRIDIAVGYINPGALADISGFLHDYPKTELRMLVGMQYLEGFTQPQIDALEKLNEQLQGRMESSLLVSTRVKYHGKVYHFTEEDTSESAYIGSANLAAIQDAYRSTFEAGVVITSEAYDIGEYLKSHVFPLGTEFDTLEIQATCTETTPLENLVRDRLVEKIPEGEPKELTKYQPKFSYEIPLKDTPSSNLNCFFGKGREHKPTGKILRRPWYEVELIPGVEITRQEGYPQNKARFEVVTDDGYSFECNVNGQNGNKNFRSSESLSILGTFLKGRLEAQGVLKVGEPVTKEHLEKYGRSTVNLSYYEETGRWILDFRN
ncbi:restriction endonuclease PLD domain-containing protein [Corynebacterium sp. H128]|uniref:restriction endonuclease PLD domain-containing protein n=1 Tax=Corynebacterium sp. H128 TaxID=3133427 RepID=UPI0030A6E7E0